MNIRARIRRLQDAVLGAGSHKQGDAFPEECICFPSDEPPGLWWRAEAEAAAAVRCPLHGKRFDHLNRLQPPYKALRFRKQYFEAGWSEKSSQYHKAMRASFPSDRWPQAHERTEADGSTTLILRDGTELPAMGRTEEWH